MPGGKGIEHRPERQPMGSGAVNEHNARPIATHVIFEGGPIDRNGAHTADTMTSHTDPPQRRLHQTDRSGATRI
jgi:hypothetical protein